MIPSLYRGLTSALGVLPATWEPTPRAEGPADYVLHGASAGEVKAALCTLPALRTDDHARSWLLTTGTDAGLRAGASVRLPRDAPRAVSAFLDRVQPRALILAEADLWPNLLAEAEGRGMPVGVVGARMSVASARRWSRFPRTARRWLGSVQAWAAASEEDATRLVGIGMAPGSVVVAGWLKWPEPAAPLADHGLDDLFDPVAADRPLFVLGSVHPGELTRLAERLGDGPLAPGRARWLAVARHASRVGALGREGRRICPPGTFAVDGRFGVLRGWWGLADAAFVGGGGTGRGVHDLLEPVSAGLRPICSLGAGDPAGVGRTLVAEGLALSDEASITDLPTRCDGAWTGLRARHDGRRRAADFLASHGVLSRPPGVRSDPGEPDRW